ncbi:MAG: 4-hydroxy-tetrahydrodipicolinate synthase [Myxococcota bacterium]
MTFEGAMTALVTPFTADGAVDEETLRALVERQIAGGIGGLVPCGTTGEAPTLDLDEHARVIQVTAEVAAGRVPVLAGIGSNDTRTAIENAHRAQAAGAQGVLATAPYYNKPSQEGLFRHFKAIAEAVPALEVCIYDVPGRSVVKVAPETTERLSVLDNVTCVKDATGDMAHGAEVYRRVEGRVGLLSGDDFTTMTLIALGGVGCVSVASNLAPKTISAMVAAAREGRMDEARAMNARLQPFFQALFIQTNPLPIKAAMASRGLCLDRFRLPLCPMDDGPRTKLMTVLEGFSDLD